MRRSGSASGLLNASDADHGATISVETRLFSKSDLARCDGKAGAPAYIAYRGKVYDVSRSFLWQEGRHQVVHTAGSDLTKDLDQAPHGADLLARVPMIGSLAEE